MLTIKTPLQNITRRQSKYLVLLGFMYSLLLVPQLATADIAGAEEAVSNMNAAMTTIEKAMKESKGGDAEGASELARVAITQSEAAIKALPSHDAHGRQAIDLLKEAITHLQVVARVSTDLGAKKAGSDVMSALDFVDAALMHVQHAH